ncbi:tyrosinase family protein [Catellatospora sp. NPDC049609]|uniref:tyrosinase family protein n=1 Tax=Catellatospora sp. NPDC049609 TaxID=3155505 RepID=UPI0034182450
MTAVRANIQTSDTARARFVEGVVALNAEPSGYTTSQLNQLLSPSVPGFRLYGVDQPLTTWDLFVLWHFLAMQMPSTPARPMRNLAHGGPIFLPWHRMYLLRLEQQIQRVTGDAEAGLPYWDWTADGGLPTDQQHASSLWGEAALGDARGDVVSGPLAAMRVRLVGYGTQLWSVAPRPLQRQAGTDPDVPGLPTAEDAKWVLEDGLGYDSVPWDVSSDGFRNRVEGWLDPRRPGQAGAPQMHNRVHVWVGGDMGPGSSPNDPLFYLNHCNVDRLWEAWLSRRGRSYAPGAGDDQVPTGQGLNDTMVTLLGEPLTPAQTLDPSAWYSYDSLA